MHVVIVESSVDRQTHPVVTGLWHLHLPGRLLIPSLLLFLSRHRRLLHHLRFQLELVVAKVLWHEAHARRHGIMGLKVGH